MASGSYGEYRPPQGAPVIQYHVGENPPQQYNVNTGGWQVPSTYLGHEESSTSSFRYPIHSQHIFDIGIFRDTLAPSLALHSSLSVLAWGLGRHFDRVEAKDWLWPSGMVLNTWWSAVGHRVLIDGLPLSLVSRTISWPERLILAGVTAWGGRLLYRIASRALARGEDDSRYAEGKKRESFWNEALIKTFLPEALVQTIITLPFVAPFRHRGAVMSGYHPALQSLAVGIFSAGFALEVLADYQLESHKQDKGTATSMQKTGVWSIVRHPNYLGDALLQVSFPLLLFSSDMLAPIELLGPITNYLYLRYVGGINELETSMETRYEKDDPARHKELKQWQQEKNSFWPKLQEIQNPATWMVVGAGIAGVVLERVVRELVH